MARWEYLVWYLDSTTEAESLTEDLNNYGKQGWELVAVASHGSSNYPDRPLAAFFKKQKGGN